MPVLQQLGIILAVGSLILVVIVHTVIIARWSGRTSQLLEGHDKELAELKKITRHHDGRILELEVETKARQLFVKWKAATT